MKRFWDYELNEKENIKLEELLKEVPTFDEYCHPAGGIPSQDDIDSYERLYGDIIRLARDAVTE